MSDIPFAELDTESTHRRVALSGGSRGRVCSTWGVVLGLGVGTLIQVGFIGSISFFSRLVVFVNLCLTVYSPSKLTKGYLYVC